MIGEVWYDKSYDEKLIATAKTALLVTLIIGAVLWANT